MSTIRTSSLPAAQVENAIALLARAFATNPLHIAAFGTARLDYNEVFFRIGLRNMKGKKLIATDGARVLGVAHWVHSNSCQFSTLEKLRTLPAILQGLSPRAATRVLSWVSAWSAHDLDEPHCHLGPIGVDSDAQGQGIGSVLMQEYCADVDRMDVSGFLETDRPENIAFYERFGFTVTDTARVLGIETWFMRRSRVAR